MKLAFISEKEKPVAAQIFSSNTEHIVNAAKILEKKGFDIIDFNFGCPSKKIMQQGSGGALLKRKNKVAEIVKELSESVNIPITVKIRSGFDKKNINAVEIAKLCEKNGASAIIIHARTIEQGYSGKADWEIIKRVKENVKIPVIGNGDIFNGEDAERMLNETDCDYVMIGRGAIGNPFIFHQINEYLRTGKNIYQTPKEKISDFFEYTELTKKYNIFSVKDAKLRAQEFTKGLAGSSKLRQRLNRIKTWDEIEVMMREMISTASLRSAA
jgi:nifR3 family TIM-barrel protein